MNGQEFSGRTVSLAKRRAMNYWYVNRRSLGLTMAEFFKRCRLREDAHATKIVFYPRNAV